MITYAVQYDDNTNGTSGKKPVVIARTDDLGEAIKLCEASKRPAYVLHVATDLQRHVFEGRPVWLDALGRERPSPARGSAR